MMTDLRVKRIGAKIKIRRIAAGYSQVAFANRCNVSGACICQIESGKNLPSFRLAVKMASVLQTSVTALIT